MSAPGRTLTAVSAWAQIPEPLLRRAAAAVAEAEALPSAAGSNLAGSGAATLPAWAAPELQPQLQPQPRAAQPAAAAAAAVPPPAGVLASQQMPLSGLAFQKPVLDRQRSAPATRQNGAGNKSSSGNGSGTVGGPPPSVQQQQLAARQGQRQGQQAAAQPPFASQQPPAQSRSPDATDPFFRAVTSRSNGRGGSSMPVAKPSSAAAATGNASPRAPPGTAAGSWPWARSPAPEVATNGSRAAQPPAATPLPALDRTLSIAEAAAQAARQPAQVPAGAARRNGSGPSSNGAAPDSVLYQGGDSLASSKAADAQESASVQQRQQQQRKRPSPASPSPIVQNPIPLRVPKVTDEWCWASGTYKRVD